MELQWLELKRIVKLCSDLSEVRAIDKNRMNRSSKKFEKVIYTDLLLPDYKN